MYRVGRVAHPPSGVEFPAEAAGLHTDNPRRTHEKLYLLVFVLEMEPLMNADGRRFSTGKATASLYLHLRSSSVPLRVSERGACIRGFLCFCKRQ